MPVYEYFCAFCQKKFSQLLTFSEADLPQICPFCGEDETRRLISKFTRGRSEDSRVEEVADWVESSADPESPGQMRQMVREMGKALDEDVSDDMEEMLESEWDT